MDGYAVSKYYSKRNNIKRFFIDLEQLVEVIQKDLTKHQLVYGTNPFVSNRINKGFCFFINKLLTIYIYLFLFN